MGPFGPEGPLNLNILKPAKTYMELQTLQYQLILNVKSVFTFFYKTTLFKYTSHQLKTTAKGQRFSVRPRPREAHPCFYLQQGGAQ